MYQPLFVLSAPRCFSSVIGTMLGQHPQTYGLPELNLFVGDTLGDVWNMLDVVFKAGTDGLLRTLAELHEGEQTEETVIRAREWVMRRTNWPIKRVLDHISEHVGDKMIVEKGPTQAFLGGALDRIYDNYPMANYLHLVRHPRAQGTSALRLQEYIQQKQLRQGARGGGAPRDPEKTWSLCQRNITDFTRTLPPGQAMRVKGEDVMRAPHLYLRQICQWLEIDDSDDAIEAMLHPERSPYACIGPASAPHGNDPNFLNEPALDHARMAKIKEPSLKGEVDWRPGETFTPVVQKLAKEFGYS